MGEMEFNISRATERYNSIRNEIEYRQRRWNDFAISAVAEIARISQADVDRLSSDFPALVEVRKYTAEQLARNEHNEQETLLRLWQDMVAELNRNLEEFERRLDEH